MSATLAASPGASTNSWFNPTVGAVTLSSQATSANTCLVQVEKFAGRAPTVTSFGGPTEVDVEGREVKLS